MESARPLIQRAIVLLGAAMLLATPTLAYASLRAERPDLLRSSLATAALALGCGLAARGRGVTLALVVPSLVYLAVVWGA